MNVANKDNKEKDTTKSKEKTTLAKTGSKVGSTLVMIMGVSLIISGVVLSRKRKIRN